MTKNTQAKQEQIIAQLNADYSASINSGERALIKERLSAVTDAGKAPRVAKWLKYGADKARREANEALLRAQRLSERESTTLEGNISLFGV